MKTIRLTNPIAAALLATALVGLVPSCTGNFEEINRNPNEAILALADVLRVAIMHRMTDTYGPIPYSKVVENKKESLAVAYDSQQEVYTHMFSELDAAISVLDANRTLSTAAFGKFDGVYGGDITKWLKYANSLKLRLAMRLSYVDQTTARTKAAEAIAAGVILTNDDNANLRLEENRTALCWNDWGDHRVGGDIIACMNGYNDPRREKMFTKVTLGEGEQARQGFAGLRIGTVPTSKDDAKAAYSNILISGTTPYLWMNAAEVAFLRAEYELRWGSADEARALYEKGVELSFEERGAAGAADYLAQTEAKPADYVDNLGAANARALSEITIPWEEGEAAFERNLERIITQKWIAIFPLGTEAWAEYRRTGYPRLLPAPRNNSGGTVDASLGARRLNYPSEEYTENPVHVADAVRKLGGTDNCGTRLWWDVKNL